MHGYLLSCRDFKGNLQVSILLRTTSLTAKHPFQFIELSHIVLLYSCVRSYFSFRLCLYFITGKANLIITGVKGIF